MYDAWTNPETLRIISSIAGVELIPNIEYEIAHINVSVKTDEEQSREAEIIEEQDRNANAGGVGSDDEAFSAPVVGWHKDSYPFVAVLMLSDASQMRGGETALRTGKGDVMKVRGPQMVSSEIIANVNTVNLKV